MRQAIPRDAKKNSWPQLRISMDRQVVDTKTIGVTKGDSTLRWPNLFSHQNIPQN